jgi:ABC-type nickel/cobalt efflux system permease component RcnA
MLTGPKFTKRSALASAILAILALLMAAGGAGAHPLGNFTINHFSRVEVGREHVKLRFVVDMAEISTIQQLGSAGVVNANNPTQAELDSFLSRAADEFKQGLALTIDGSPLELTCERMNISVLPGAGGLNTLRIDCDYRATLPKLEPAQAYRRLGFEDNNHVSRIGWHEIVIKPDVGITVFDSSAYGNAITDELKAYPQDAISAPLDERTAQLSFTTGSVAPAGTRPLITRDGRQCTSSRDRLAELIAVPEITPGIVLLGLLLAAGLGSLHSLSPGHGKTVVGAYLVGSRGTARHAAFLGLTVTITHTAGVFALGLVTLLASHYILPEQLYPVLSLISGVIVVAIGASLFFKRLGAARRGSPVHKPEHAHPHQVHDHRPHHLHADRDDDPGSDHEHTHAHDHELTHWHLTAHQSHTHAHTHSHHHDNVHAHGHADSERDHTGQMHSHGGRSHSHLPLGSDGSPITWRSLVALGISGGLLPCPSALVVLLASISLHRVGYGLLLVIAFSLGLASALTAVGLLFVYAGRVMKSRSAGRLAFAARFVPVLSALVITCAGAIICWQALVQAGWRPLPG